MDSLDIRQRGLPLLCPKFLTKNNLWDSSWLSQKYPDRFNTGGYYKK